MIILTAMGICCYHTCTDNFVQSDVSEINWYLAVSTLLQYKRFLILKFPGNILMKWLQYILQHSQYAVVANYHFQEAPVRAYKSKRKISSKHYIYNKIQMH